MGLIFHFLLLILCFVPFCVCQVKEFISIDCGSTRSNYTDPSTRLEWISDIGIMSHGISAQVENPNVDLPQYQRRRDFPIDIKKYCYTLSTEERRRYIVRATFLYGSSVNEDTFPKFQLYLDATKWSTVTVLDASSLYVKEMIIRAPSNSIDVCLCCATTGSPFISTLELRPLNLSMYATDFEDDFYMKVAARVNFGAPTKEAVRYPDDPYDRIWESDLDKRQNFLVGIAPGTERINTTKNINVNTREYPPVKVMQSAVVGTKGSLTYRLNLEDFPANARAYAYFAEIEDLGANETRKFKMQQPYMPDYSNAVVNIAENANGSYTLYEPSYMNVTLDFVLSFSFVKTRDSSRGPLLNAIEISKYVQRAPKTDEQDVEVVNALRSVSAESAETNEGDPCVPVSWEWVNCSSIIPPRITKIMLSGKNVHGEIPSGLKNMDALTELWLDGNSLTGPMPDMSNLINLKIVYVENNCLSGEIPSALLAGNITFNYKGNPDLSRKAKHKIHYKLILGVSIGVLAILFFLLVGSLLLLRNLRTKTSYQRSDDKGDSLRMTTKPLSPYSIARGLEYLHTGCNPSIIHRDVKTSNILLDIHMRAKVSDFGLSRQAEEDLTHISSVARGTVGYLDPEYYANQQLTEKSDVYSFGVVLLELISGRKPVSTEDYGAEWNIVHWARSLIRKGDVISIIDPSLAESVKIESVWRIAEAAIQCVEQHGYSRPRMQEVILATQDAIKIQKGNEKLSSGSSRAPSARKTLLTSFLDIESPDLSNGCLHPSAR
ncbi:hypothetical protein HYC85_015450 [Camellia sinensis]|uniref:Protein kinase domain-containing protein n=1 Tax=Camellia sinensis TaxID=4442 RepID=A0A7J7GWR1_CAMSI|nr:hypothetical protein HYC85_015450 [Camellia sinensis]